MVIVFECSNSFERRGVDYTACAPRNQTPLPTFAAALIGSTHSTKLQRNRVSVARNIALSALLHWTLLKSKEQHDTLLLVVKPGLTPGFEPKTLSCARRQAIFAIVFKEVQA